MAHHVLKSWPEHFAAVQGGLKRAELRHDDRSPAFARGDTLVLQEWMPQPTLKGPGGGTYTGRQLLVDVTHAARGPPLPEGYALLSIDVQDYQEVQA